MLQNKYLRRHTSASKTQLQYSRKRALQIWWSTYFASLLRAARYSTGAIPNDMDAIPHLLLPTIPGYALRKSRQRLRHTLASMAPNRTMLNFRAQAQMFWAAARYSTLQAVHERAIVYNTYFFALTVGQPKWNAENRYPVWESSGKSVSWPRSPSVRNSHR